ncbi:protein SOSEKI 2-like [Curcuma longa]|uniref:protein SOSEKI 2-like n=1 Tax=Curcuma longa TaxID=136217 RepID=UPI003D9DCB50
MEVGGGRGRRRLSSRESSPDRAKLGYSQQQQPPPRPLPQQRFARPLRKLQVVYYLCRNGQLEHPHFIELPYLPNHQLRLKDVIERLTLLRGKGMPSLFSWSFKRSYKNGYVWNDLVENDIIYPADGVEYVLKGSEIFPGAYDRFQHLPASSRQLKALPAPRKLHWEFVDDDDTEDMEQGEEEETGVGKLNVGEKMRVGYSRRTCGVSTEEMERVDCRTAARASHHHAPTELPLDDSSPQSSSSSDKPHNQAYPVAAACGGVSQRFDDVDPAPEPGLSRNSVLLQLIACGSAALKGRSTQNSGAIKAASAAANSASDAAAVSAGCVRHNSGLHCGAASRLTGRAADDDESSRCYSENPRYCHPLIEDKEYFSGSIVEGSRGRVPPEPILQKSSSYNEERSSKVGIGEEERAGKGVKGKCIPGRRRCSGKQQ